MTRRGRCLKCGRLIAPKDTRQTTFKGQKVFYHGRDGKPRPLMIHKEDGGVIKEVRSRAKAGN